MVTYALFNKLNGNELNLMVPFHDLEKIRKFKEGEIVKIEITRQKDKRTLAQNRYIWLIISMIDEKVNGYCSDEMNIYCQIIEQAKIKTDYIQTLETAKARLEDVYRVVKEIEKRGNSVLYRCYLGTSQFTKEEMARFIEVLIDRAYQEDIDILQYEKILRGE